MTMTPKKKRTESQALASAPMRIKLGGVEHAVAPLPYGPALDWAERLGALQDEHSALASGVMTNLMENVKGLRAITELIFDYMAIPLEYRKELLSKATKAEMQGALAVIVTEVFS